jgi:hypothetical protein
LGGKEVITAKENLAKAKMSQTPELKLQIAQMKMKYLKEQIWMLHCIEEAEQRDKNEGETFVYKQISDFQYELVCEIQELQKEIQELTETVAEGDPE